MDFAEKVMAASRWFAPAWTDYLAYLAGVKSLIGVIPHQVVTTAIWAGLIFWGARKYEKPMTLLIVAIHHRIVTGSGVKIGAFELTPTPDSVIRIHAAMDAAAAASAPPEEPATAAGIGGNGQANQDPSGKPSARANQDRRAKARREDAQTNAPRQPSSGGSETTDSGSFIVPQRGDMLALYYQAEDLVLRMLEDQYGESLRRHVTIGGALAVDAVIGEPTSLTIVDVTLTGRNSGANVNYKLQNMYANLQLPELAHWGIKGVRQIVVYTDDTDLYQLKRHIASAERRWSAYATSITLEVQLFSMADLRERVGGHG